VAPTNVIHETELVALHEHPELAVIDTLPDDIDDQTDTAVGEMLTSHWPDCVTVKARPAIVNIPVRTAEVVFAATLKVTVPFPVPVAPPVMVIQATELVAVQLQPPLAVTATLFVIASAPIDRLVGEMLKLQAAAWVTENVRPATTMVPVRESVLMLAATLKVTVSGPVPVLPLVRVIHGAELRAVHVQPAGAVTVTLPVVTSGPTETSVGEMLYVQVTPACVTRNVQPAIARVPDRDAPPALAAML
jgi:hypothetical protein